LSLKFQVDSPLCHFEGDDDFSSHSFTYASHLETNLTLDSPEDALNIPKPPRPLVALGQPTGGENFKIEPSIDELDACDKSTFW